MIKFSQPTSTYNQWYPAASLILVISLMISRIIPNNAISIITYDRLILHMLLTIQPFSHKIAVVSPSYLHICSFKQPMTPRQGTQRFRRFLDFRVAHLSRCTGRMRCQDQPGWVSWIAGNTNRNVKGVHLDLMIS